MAKWPRLRRVPLGSYPSPTLSLCRIYHGPSGHYFHVCSAKLKNYAKIELIAILPSQLKGNVTVSVSIQL